MEPTGQDKLEYASPDTPDVRDDRTLRYYREPPDFAVLICLALGIGVVLLAALAWGVFAVRQRFNW